MILREQNARHLAVGCGVAPGEAENLPGDFSSLLRQIGWPDSAPDSIEFSPLFEVSDISDLRSLELFLETYLSQFLLPVELPTIVGACERAARGESRELIELDQLLATRQPPAAFASASRRIGRIRLERFRPMRDHRVAQRYLAAVESGRAAGWHPLVYGLMLAIYSLPLRQGLLHYATQTLAGIAGAAARSRHFSDDAVREILEPMLIRLPKEMLIEGLKNT